MRRKLLLGLVAISGALTVVGSGFAAWYFDVTDFSASKTISTQVTPLADNIGTLTDLNKDDTIKIVLDQGGYTNLSETTKGISIVKCTSGSTDSNLDALQAKYEISKTNAEYLVAAGITSGTFTVKYELTPTAKKYIEFKTPSVKFGDKDPTNTTTSTESFTCTYEVKFNEISSDYSVIASVDTTTTDKVNALLKYKSKPTDKTSYESMSSDFETSSIALTVSYTFAVNTTTGA